MFDNDDLVHSYSQAQAIADGVPVDAGGTAREAGAGVVSRGTPGPRCG
jgi:hypothetical protein